MTPLTLSTASRGLLAAAALAVAVPAAAQTPVELHANRFSPQQDVELGRQVAAEVRTQLPALDDGRTGSFVAAIGRRLTAQIPEQYRQPAFRYSFEVLNLQDINAFALPGGPMFLNRGMIEAARTDGEVAGVMAHELAHVILRHGTAQATEAQKFQLGALAGQVLGSIIGGRAGAVVAQGSEIGLGTYFLRYGREYEREADLVGAQIMARAGYDPRQMASMFETIERAGGTRGPEWLSSHPNPGNRAQAITREAEMLRVAPSPASPGDLQAVHARLQQLPPAMTTAQAARARQGQQPEARPTGTSGSLARVEQPSEQWRTHRAGSALQLAVPANWHPIEGSGTIRYAPRGGVVEAADGRSSFTHGVEVGIARGGSGTLQQQTDALVQQFARANPQLRRQGNYARTTIAGRPGLTATLSNVSDATGAREAVTVSTAALGDGRLLFLVGVAPADEARTYANVFGRVRQSVQLAER